MLDAREKQRRKRERLRIEREQHRQRIAGLVWGLITILAVFAVLFVGLSAGSHEALAATNKTLDESLDANLGLGEVYESSKPFRTSSLGVIEPIDSPDPPVHSGKGCKADMRWPVLPHVLIRRFKAPKNAWGPGHRGVDLAAVENTPLLAPASGFISFSGVVAGKSVVSIRHKGLTLTFEPAQTLLPIGTPVVKGLPIGTVTGVSDHCTGICVHWGVKKSKKEYRDPQQLAAKRKIVLKPVSP
ncbi:peptidoglycan DD-metalloendopeptidase family protein [Bifidobacterium sp. ESL0732]|uniref:M23 family metallopeptidase n=1 Tax=Bifidobacterium sp. ESL0732 TaxID=2983222 RepID=UPI0023F9F8C0|nr:peptidoglycan DD-metalloendopeptidase family protein [Bifidobacterium sp. ESL0732]WEV63309.1 peptidoglycan DD-metalloendopeptidase family protein [Bifidobacterium sp. ESL0732]